MPASPSAATQAPFPEHVGKYELLIPIGTGGMATVYLARATGVGGFARDVALKLVHAHLRSDEESKLQLLEEAKLAAKIRHPNVVPVLEVDEDPFGLFLVMDYVEGENLAGLVRAAKAAGMPLSHRLIARILNDALLGLHAAHELLDDDGSPLNLVHRDFSPQNILVSVQGTARLGDFGVAKAADRAVRTKTGLVKGKINYMSPEQARGYAVDRRCDVWAAGVVAWELLARQRLHTADDDVATLLSIVTEHPPRLSSVVASIPPQIDDAVDWALTPYLDDRCPTAEHLRQALEFGWQQWDGMADTAELAAFVQRIVGPKLAERSDSIAEVRALRQRMGQLARAKLDEEEERSPTVARRSHHPVSHPDGERTRSSRPSLGSMPDERSSRPSFASTPDERISRPSFAPGRTAAVADSKRIGDNRQHSTELSASVPFSNPKVKNRLTILGSAIGGGLLALVLTLIFLRPPSTGARSDVNTPGVSPQSWQQLPSALLDSVTGAAGLPNHSPSTASGPTRPEPSSKPSDESAETSTNTGLKRQAHRASAPAVARPRRPARPPRSSRPASAESPRDSNKRSSAPARQDEAPKNEAPKNQASKTPTHNPALPDNRKPGLATNPYAEPKSAK